MKAGFYLWYNSKMKQRGLANILIILLGFLIIFVLIGYFKNQKTPYFNFGDVFQSGVNENLNLNDNHVGYPYISCGVQINSPFVFSDVEKVFEFSGNISDCGWVAQNGFAGVFEMLDSQNNPLTDQISVPVNPDGSFKVNIAIKRNPVNKLDMALINFRGYGPSQIASFNVYLK